MIYLPIVTLCRLQGPMGFKTAPPRHHVNVIRYTATATNERTGAGHEPHPHERVSLPTECHERRRRSGRRGTLPTTNPQRG